LLLAVAGYFLLSPASHGEPPAPVRLADAEGPPRGADPDAVHQFCSTCHAYPTPDSFPREHWPKEVRRAYDFFRDSKHRSNAPDMEGVIEYYLRRAPREYPPQQKCPAATGPLPVRFERFGSAPAAGPATAKVTNVHLAHLFSDTKLDVLVCHYNPGQLWAMKPYDSPPSWHLLAEILGPCHVEVVDLDGDGIKDLVVADLGSLPPTEHRTGRVVWLKGDRDGRFAPVVLLDGVGRVTDVRVRDFNGDGKPDLVVAVFGWHQGEVLYLENRTSDWAKPDFRPTTLDARSGAVALDVGDVNGDGKLDVVALLSQEHETAVAFLGDGKGGFTPKTAYAAPHPAYGSSGIQLVDLDGDGDLDILYTNGDTLDPPFLLKPYHGVQWLENRGTFPFVHRPITAQYGAMRAVAADFGDGTRCVVSVAFLPPPVHAPAREAGAEAVQILRPVAPGRFERHVLAGGDCAHFSCAAGDLFGDGRAHLVVGNYHMTPGEGKGDLVTVWKNLGPKK
jgi:hypothetical protein